MFPAASRSPALARITSSSGPWTMTRAASARIETFAAVLALRIWPSMVAAVCSTAGLPASAPAWAGPASPAPPDGQAARCTDPSCHQDHTSSVTNGRNGANSRSSTDSAARSAPRADAAAGPGAARSAPYARAFTSSR